MSKPNKRVWHLIPHEAVPHWQPPITCVMTGAAASLVSARACYTMPGVSTIEHRLAFLTGRRTRLRVAAMDIAVIAAAILCWSVAVSIHLPLVLLIAPTLLSAVAVFAVHYRARPRLRGRSDGVWARVAAHGVPALDDAIVSALRAHHGLVRVPSPHPSPDVQVSHTVPKAGTVSRTMAAAPVRMKNVGAGKGAGKNVRTDRESSAYFAPTSAVLGHLDAGRYDAAAAAIVSLPADEQLLVLWQANPTRSARWPLGAGPRGLAELVQGVGLVRIGWGFRGTGLAESVPREALERFWSHLRDAEARFQEAHNVSPNNPLPAAALLTSGRGLEIPARDLRARADASLGVYPTFAAASAFVVAIGPMSGGRAEDAARFVASILESTPVGHPARGVAAFAARECVHARQMTTSCRRQFGKLVDELLAGPPPGNSVQLEILAETAYVTARLSDPRTPDLLGRLDGRWCGTWKYLPDPMSIVRTAVPGTSAATANRTAGGGSERGRNTGQHRLAS